MEKLNSCPICNHSIFEPYISSTDYFLSGEAFEIVSCSNCGFRFTNPRPKPSDLGNYYKSTNYISHSNTSKGLFSLVYQRVRNYTLKQKQYLIEKNSTKGTILDIGCATGHFLNQLKLSGWNTIGVEPDRETREAAIREFGLNVVDEPELETITNETIDCITMWHVLEHVSELNQRVAQIFKLIKQDGIVFIAVPNSNSFDAIHYGKYWAGYDVPRHLYHFTQKDIKLLFEKHGFTLLKTLPMKFDAFYVSLLSEKYKSGKMNLFSAFLTAFRSNVKYGAKNGYSSLIFVFKKK